MAFANGDILLGLRRLDTADAILYHFDSAGALLGTTAMDAGHVGTSQIQPRGCCILDGAAYVTLNASVGAGEHDDLAVITTDGLVDSYISLDALGDSGSLVNDVAASSGGTLLVLCSIGAAPSTPNLYRITTGGSVLESWTWGTSNNYALARVAVVSDACKVYTWTDFLASFGQGVAGLNLCTDSVLFENNIPTVAPVDFDHSPDCQRWLCGYGPSDNLLAVRLGADYATEIDVRDVFTLPDPGNQIFNNMGQLSLDGDAIWFSVGDFSGSPTTNYLYRYDILGESTTLVYTIAAVGDQFSGKVQKPLAICGGRLFTQIMAIH